MDDKDRENPDDLKGGANGVVGAAAGVGVGGVVGAVLGAAVAGPVGMMVGGGLGTMLGAAAGYAIDFDMHEPEFRHHHDSIRPQGGPTFDQASPAYRYGWEGHDRPELQGRSFDQARPALHRGWTGSGDFADHEAYVKHGWERRAAGQSAAAPESPAGA